ncbi:acyl-CoA dehydrogenase [Leptolyngbyaceae cyanobacterium CCMR0082]|uniref:Acyl-CoA dehydrogenase n=1 Tax=Adonisia turfae CCMR0082 TaxID=2304604 RepID=A0A6M0SI40_9CYAN|nr:acyl-CoA dehydrogenase family protein [Adonisia turfae]NEZ67996.1 acyl-CoA dehydrogenase [Adonisia turfae CCMR0082]
MKSLKQYWVAEALERSLGNPFIPENPLSFQHMATLDEQEVFPEGEIKGLYDWGLQHYYIPTDCGGKFTSFEEFVAFVRVLSRRDLNTAIAFTTMFWSFLTWMAGTETQKQQLARFMQDDYGTMCLAYSEREHGSDLVGGSLVGEKVPGGYRLTGEKWPINRATRSEITFVLARTDKAGGNRGLSLFMLDKRALDPTSFGNNPKIKTHGIRGADMSGIYFEDCFVPDEMLLGKEGQGLELALKGFQITRALCAAFSQGSADTCLRTTLNFALNRQLYGKTVWDMPHPRRVLVNGFLDILACDCVNIAAARGFHVAPRQFSVWSAVDKYFVPVTLEKMQQDISVVLGARFYMRDEHDYGVFQKMLRDSSIISVFDGSSVVNLHALILQRRQLAKARSRRKPKDLVALQARLRNSFNLTTELPTFDPSQLDLIARGTDDVPQGLESALATLEALGNPLDIDENVLDCLKQQYQQFLQVLDEQDEAIVDGAFEHGHDQSFEAFEEAKRYCYIHAATTCLHMWLHNRSQLGDFFAQGKWLVLCADRLLAQLTPEQPAIPLAYYETVAEELLRLHGADKMLSIVPFQLAQLTSSVNASAPIKSPAPILQV